MSMPQGAICKSSAVKEGDPSSSRMEAGTLRRSLLALAPHHSPRYYEKGQIKVVTEAGASHFQWPYPYARILGSCSPISRIQSGTRQDRGLPASMYQFMAKFVEPPPAAHVHRREADDLTPFLDKTGITPSEWKQRREKAQGQEAEAPEKPLDLSKFGYGGLLCHGHALGQQIIEAPLDLSKYGEGLAGRMHITRRALTPHANDCAPGAPAPGESTPVATLAMAPTLELGSEDPQSAAGAAVDAPANMAVVPFGFNFEEARKAGPQENTDRREAARALVRLRQTPTLRVQPTVTMEPFQMLLDAALRGPVSQRIIPGKLPLKKRKITTEGQSMAVATRAPTPTTRVQRVQPMYPLRYPYSIAHLL